MTLCLWSEFANRQGWVGASALLKFQCFGINFSYCVWNEAQTGLPMHTNLLKDQQKNGDDSYVYTLSHNLC